MTTSPKERDDQETLLQTIRARLERNENGEIKAIWDANGDFEIVERTEGKLIRYFTPTYTTGFDIYGNNKNPTNEHRE